MSSLQFILVTWLGICVISVFGRGKEEKITFKPPALTPEEQESDHMPQYMKCDGCKAVSYQLYLKFAKFNKLYPSRKYEMKESEMIDTIEEVCEDNDNWNRFAVKEHEGKLYLSGDGLPAKNLPGVLQGGGKWPSRLMSMCLAFSGDLGEEAIYEGYKENPKTRKSLEQFLCWGEGITGSCVGMEDPDIDRDALRPKKADGATTQKIEL